jgi:protein SCO1/2
MGFSGGKPFGAHTKVGVSISDFKGQAIVLTFFFMRCPIPEFCQPVTKLRRSIQCKSSAMPNTPANWHLLPVMFGPARDTPEVLKAYGTSCQYDPLHWSFLRGPKDKIAESARLCDVKFEPDNGSFNHNFRTLIIDASNHLQMGFPTSGNISESIVQGLLEAAGGTNRIREPATSCVRSESEK